MPTLTRNAYAKINLFLDIESRRNDGYHNIVSVMQSVSLCDAVTVEYKNAPDKKIDITCNNPEIPTGEKNIAYKAADILIDSGHIKIHIEKRIPASAGLAGGSTDAAAVLLMLNELTGSKKSEKELLDIGAKIGADVPFCMIGGTKLTLGIGERMMDFTPMPDTNIVIACSGEGVSTPKAYGELDLMYHNFENYTVHHKELEALRMNPDNTACMFNIFESVVIPMRPMVSRLKETMMSCGASFSMMSGSGPSVFGIFSSKQDAEKAASMLLEMGADAYLCTPKQAK